MPILLLAACSSNDQEPASPDDAPASSTAPLQPGEEEPPPTFAPLDDATNDPAVEAAPLAPPADLADLGDLEGSLVLRDERGNLVLTQPNGGGRREIASGEGRLLSQPTFSHNADRIAWSATDTTGATLFVADIDGANEVSTSLDSPAFYLAWSAGDSWIAGLRPVPGNIEFFVAESSSVAVRAVGSGQPFYFDWRDDETLVAAINTTTLAEIRAPGDTEPSLLPIDSPLGIFQTPGVVEGDAEPRDRLVVAMIQDGANDVVVLGPDQEHESIGRANGPITIAVNPVDQRVAVQVLDTEPQSQVIGFQVDTPPTLASGQVSIIDLETREVITRSERQVVAMQWSPDGSSLALLQSTGTALQWLVTRPDDVVALTPFVPSQAIATSYLPFADQYNHSSTWWSPDSRAIVMSGVVDGESGVWVDLVDDERTAVRVSNGDLALWSQR